jgi:hypothetical protein
MQLEMRDECVRLLKGERVVASHAEVGSEIHLSDGIGLTERTLGTINPVSSIT